MTEIKSAKEWRDHNWPDAGECDEEPMLNFIRMVQVDVLECAADSIQSAVVGHPDICKFLADSLRFQARKIGKQEVK